LPTEADVDAGDSQQMQGDYALESLEINGAHYYAGGESVLVRLHNLWARKSLKGQFTEFKAWLESSHSDNAGDPVDKTLKKTLMDQLPSTRLLYLQAEKSPGELSEEQKWYELTATGSTGEYSVPAFGGKFKVEGITISVPHEMKVSYYVGDKSPSADVKKWGEANSPITRDKRQFQKHVYPMDKQANPYNYIFALRREKVLMCPKMENLMHHSSLFHGKPVKSAGTLAFGPVNGKAKLVGVTLLSGHYRPQDERMGSILEWFWNKGFTNHDFWCDAQHGVDCHLMTVEGVITKFKCKDNFGYVMDGKDCNGKNIEIPNN